MSTKKNLKLNYYHKLKYADPFTAFLDETSLFDDVPEGPIQLTPVKTNKTTITFVCTRDGKPAGNVNVTAKVKAIYPTGWMCDIEKIKVKYERAGSKAWRKMRTLGTLNKTSGKTNSKGEFKVVYSPSNIGSSNPNQMAEERVTFTTSEGQSKKVKIFLGFTNLREVKEIPGGLIFKNANTARYMDRRVASYLESVGRKIVQDGYPKPLIITDGSHPFGGMLPPHSGHMAGFDIDFRPVTTDGNPGRAGNSRCPKARNHSRNYDLMSSMGIAELLVRKRPTAFYFNDLDISQSSCFKGHHNHMHLSWNPSLTSDAYRRGYTSIDKNEH